ncbi:MAG: hypothetical protein IJ345_08055 [Clostridia bacterium]|nr:hypothetical protein [Clostridia bacterium]
MKSNKFFSWMKIILFSGFILFCCVLGFVIPLRSQTSETEGRRLTAFPKFEINSFLSGEYTSQINLWYSDTFPARDVLLDINGEIKVLYGITTEAFGGGNVDKDEIDNDETFVWGPDIEEESSESSSGGGEVTEYETETETEEETEPIEQEVIDGYYVNGNVGYELYYFDKDYADRYARSVMQAAINLNGIARVYDIVVPTSYSFYLSDEQVEMLGASNGKEAIDYVYRAINAYSEQLVEQGVLGTTVKTLDAYSCLNKHRDEYIYYRTDHHWTGLGAYYTSRMFLDEVDRGYPTLDEYTEHRIDNFLGSLYRHTQNINLKNNPDTVFAYESPTVKTLTVLDRSTNEYIEDVIINPNIASSNKYLCFSSGDRPYYCIHNETVNDGSAILVIRESYGNAFLPMIADSYEYVYAIDYRFWNEDLVAFVQDNSIDTVLFLNNIMATSTYYNIWTMERCIN